MTFVSLCRFAALAACLAALSGCAVVDLMKPGSAPVSTRDAPGPGQQAPSSNPQEMAAIPRTAPAEAQPLEPRGLVGLTPDEARALLGKPESERSDPPATVWTWRHGLCEVDVFFYLDLGNQTFRALTYEFRGAKRQEARCLGALREETNRGRRAQN